MYRGKIVYYSKKICVYRWNGLAFIVSDEMDTWSRSRKTTAASTMRPCPRSRAAVSRTLEPLVMTSWRKETHINIIIYYNINIIIYYNINIIIYYNINIIIYFNINIIIYYIIIYIIIYYYIIILILSYYYNINIIVYNININMLTCFYVSHHLLLTILLI
jgi:hypothetical protein